MMAQTVTIQPTTPSPATENRTFALKRDGQLKISGIGDIKISAWDSDEVSLTANFSPSRPGNQHLSIEVKSNIGSLELTTGKPPSRSVRKIHGPGLSIEMKVPRGITCNIQKTHGSIELDSMGLDGKTIAITKFGGLSLKNINGDFEARTTYGSISLENVSGDLVASTMYGNIIGNAQSVGNKLDLSTIYGSIIINLLKPGDKPYASFTGTLTVQTPKVAVRGLPFTFTSSDEIRINTGTTFGNPNMNLKSKHGSVVLFGNV
jgi:hypothetical protein